MIKLWKFQIKTKKVTKYSSRSIVRSAREHAADSHGSPLPFCKGTKLLDVEPDKFE